MLRCSSGLKRCSRRPCWNSSCSHSRSSESDMRSEEHTSELQSPCNLVCRLLLEKKKKPYHKSVAASTVPSPFPTHPALLSGPPIRPTPVHHNRALNTLTACTHPTSKLDVLLTLP